MRFLRALAVMSLLAGFSVPAFAGELSKEDKEGAGALAQTFMKLWVAGDFEAMRDLYMEDATSFPPNQDPLVGREAILSREWPNRWRIAVPTWMCA